MSPNVQKKTGVYHHSHCQDKLLGWGILVNPWLIHVNVWQKPLQYCKVISLQLIKINGKKKRINCHAVVVWPSPQAWKTSYQAEHSKGSEVFSLEPASSGGRLLFRMRRVWAMQTCWVNPFCTSCEKKRERPSQVNLSTTLRNKMGQ